MQQEYAEDPATVLNGALERQRRQWQATVLDAMKRKAQRATERAAAAAAAAAAASAAATATPAAAAAAAAAATDSDSAAAAVSCMSPVSPILAVGGGSSSGSGAAASCSEGTLAALTGLQESAVRRCLRDLHARGQVRPSAGQDRWVVVASAPAPLPPPPSNMEGLLASSFGGIAIGGTGHHT